jgi:hypothetical protein
MNALDEHNIYTLLKDPDIEFELESDNKQYVFVYSTRIVAKDIDNPTQFERTYWLEQAGAGGTLVEPWDAFDVTKQTTLAQNLVRFAGYRVRGVFNGWKVVCPRCGNSMTGKIWRNSPKDCKSIPSRVRCHYVFTEHDKTRVPLQRL